MPHPTPLALAALLLAAPLVPLTPLAGSAAAAASCAGSQATIVSSASTISGTGGRDVIVVVGSGRSTVEARGGDDRVCVVGRGVVTVESGGGDDRVVSRGRAALVIADLGPGDDTYRGGEGDDLVHAGARGSDVDTISTGGGNDTITTGQRGGNRDRVDAGAGDDDVSLLGASDHTAARLVGGEGQDHLALAMDTGRALLVDANLRVATVGSRRAASWEAFEDYTLATQGAQRFVGTPTDEQVWLFGYESLSAAAGEGDDTIFVGSLRAGRAGDELDGGGGSDVLEFSGTGDIVGSLVSQTITEVGTTLDFVGMEGLRVSNDATYAADPGTVELTGDGGDNVLQGDACRVTLHGGGGNDRMRVGADPPTAYGWVAGGDPAACRRTSRVHGEAGDDLMESKDYRVARGGRLRDRPVADVLDGGDGTDVARAGTGRDACLAEIRAGCEG